MSNTYNSDNCQECGNPVGPEEYGSYCHIHRLNENGCCRNHCIIDEEGGHCIHCTPQEGDVTCELCGRIINPGYDEQFCEDCNESEATYDLIPTNFLDEVELIEDFHGIYQFMAPTREEQMERLAILNIQLCEECKMPCEYIWCTDCLN